MRVEEGEPVVPVRISIFHRSLQGIVLIQIGECANNELIQTTHIRNNWNIVMGTIFSDGLMDGQGPKYRRLVDGITRSIRNRDIAEGEKLPPVRDLAWTLQITPGTVARAYSMLSDAGWVKTEVGRGTFVAPVPVVSDAPQGQARPVQGKYRELALHKEPETDFLFAPRLPDVGQVQIIRDAIMAASELPDTLLLRYPFFSSQSFMREAIHAHIPEDERGGIDPDSIIMTNGGQNAIMLSLQTLLAEGTRVVMVEECSYPGLRRAVELLGAEVVAVPMDEDGVDPYALDQTARKTGASLLFTMPEAHNPTCTPTSIERREAVVEVARRRGFHLVQDDCYRLGPAKGPSYRNLLPGQSWFISSFSKTISPALRAGYIVTPEGWAGKLRRVVDVNYFGVSAPAAEIVYQVLTHPDTPRMVAAMRERNQQYVEIALNALGRFKLGWSHDVPFLWLHLPQGWRVSSFCK